jgi:hypothetical protein
VKASIAESFHRRFVAFDLKTDSVYLISSEFSPSSPWLPAILLLHKTPRKPRPLLTPRSLELPRLILPTYRYVFLPQSSSDLIIITVIVVVDLQSSSSSS